MTGRYGKPSSDCSFLRSPYESINGARFNLFCGNDYPGNDLMSVWVYQFIDCTHAYVSFNVKYLESSSNETCKGVSYAFTLPWGDMGYDHEAGDCFLKGFFPILAFKDSPVDSTFYADLGSPSLKR